MVDLDLEDRKTLEIYKKYSKDGLKSVLDPDGDEFKKKSKTAKSKSKQKPKKESYIIEIVKPTWHMYNLWLELNRKILLKNYIDKKEEVRGLIDDLVWDYWEID